MTSIEPSGQVLLVSQSESFRAEQAAVLGAVGPACLSVPVEAALQRPLSPPPLLVLIDGETAWQDRAASCAAFKARWRDTPVVLVATPESPTELIERCFAAGADDCLLTPLRAMQVRPRVEAVLAARARPPTPRPTAHPPLTVLVVGEDRVLAEPLMRLLSLSGYLVADGELPQPPPATLAMAVCCTEQGAEAGAELLRAALSKTGFADIPTALCCTAPASAVAGRHAVFDRRQHPPESIGRHVNAVVRPAAQGIRSDARVPFFCPVEFREAGGTSPGQWSSCFAHDLSSGGIFLKTLVPARARSAVELRIYVTMMREQLDVTGVVAWSNPYAGRSVFTYPVGMGVQFLGVISERLASLLEVCRSTAEGQ